MKPVEVLANYFINHGQPKSYIKGQILYATNDPLTSVIMIKSGLVKIYDIDSYGNERTVSIFGPNHIIPVVWLLESQKDVLYYYQALTKVEARSVHQTKILTFVKSRPDIQMYLLALLTKAYINQDARVFNLQKTNIREKLEFVLYYLAKRIGTVTDNVAVLPGIITQTELANLAGVSRETVSRELNSITAAGLVWKDGDKTYVDLSKLKSKNLPPIFGM